MGSTTSNLYCGFEQGPIRPPNEAKSLLLRITRNCPWNRCTFCPVYKGTRFSIRPVDHVKKDIDAIYKQVKRFQKLVGDAVQIPPVEIRKTIRETSPEDYAALQTAYHWIFTGGMESIFLQDANSLVIKPAHIVEILKHLKKRFPEVERITSYARSHTIARMRDDDLIAIGKAGLNRIHIGLESGSDKILKMVKKGSTKDIHVQAGLKVKKAGIELSEYIMPGLGGKALSREHAVETADALNQINPDFIRLRTLRIPKNVPLFKEYQEGRFERCSDIEVVREILMLTERLEGITSYVASDHIMNLLADFEGSLPEDKERMLKVLRTFLEMESERQRLFQVGRRLCVFSSISDLDDPRRLAITQKAFRDLGVTQENVDELTDELMKRFI